MNTLRKIARSAIALIVLAATSDAVIFQRENIAALLRKGIASIPGRFLEPTIALLSGLALLGLFIICRQLAYSVAAFARFLWVTPEQLRDAQLEHKDRIALENDLRANRIQVITTLVQSLGGIAVLIGIYFAWANLKTTQEAQKDTQKNQADALKITQEGQITDLFTKAIDQLGSPNLELRLG